MNTAPKERAVTRRILVAPNRGVGREILRRRALDGPGWVGFEHATPASLAQDLVAVDLALAGLAPADELRRRAIVDEALDAALAEDDGRLAALGEGVGFRDAVANAVDALRLAGVTPDDLGSAGLEDPDKQRALAAVLEGYEARLEECGWVDQSEVFRRAIARIEAEGLPEANILLLPALGTRGLSGRFVQALEAAGAEVLPAPAVQGLDPPAILGGEAGEAARLAWLHAVPDAPPPRPEDPEIELFAAGSPTDELREALRRVLAAGRRWDEVEIVATNPVAYGCALDALATRLGIPVTYAVGLPLERTRQGRAASRYLRWIQEDFPAAVLRELLETGDVRPHLVRGADEDRGPSGERLARRLRRLRVGWGRGRYLATIDAALRWLDEAPAEPDDDLRSPEAISTSRAREREELEALRELVANILDATPEVPDRLGRGPKRVPPAALARGLLGFLAFVPATTPVEGEARKRLTERLERIACELTRETAFGAAVAILRSRIDLRVPSPGTEGPLPWSSAGGALHFADVEHGGWTGRPLTFVMGLDAERFPGAGIQDPILLDADRRALAPEALPSSDSRLHEVRWSLAGLLARLGGTVTLSWTAWDALEGREVAPAPEILQALRLRERDPDRTYEDLHRTVHPLAGALPRVGTRLDEADAWLGALHDPQKGILLAGLEAVRAAWPRMDLGIRARDARRSPAFTKWDGLITPRPERLDPRRNGRIVSTTMLSNLGACPLRYFYSKVLRAVPPDDPELDPSAWLEARHRGSLLHDVYEISLKRARERGVDFADDEFEGIALRVLHERIERYRIQVPAPSEAVLAGEAAQLEVDVRSFVRLVRQRAPNWVDVEQSFGYGRGADPVELPVEGGTLRVCGRIDRIDEEEGGFVGVDYKTGSTWSFQAKHGTWHGGRHLQHLVYSRVIAQERGRPVLRFEYWFPTARGENDVVDYPVVQLFAGDAALEALCEIAATGAFGPTDDPKDCEYCDYKQICRAEVNEWRDVESPPAQWAETHSAAVEAYRHLRTMRTLDA